MTPAKGKWIGFDLDGVLAEYHGAQNNFEIGAPIPSMVQKCRDLLHEGWEVRIFTARIDGGLIYPLIHPEVDPVTVELYRQAKIVTEMIQDWCEKHIGKRLAVTCQKDAGMMALYDDRCIQIEENTGKVLGRDLIQTKREEIDAAFVRAGHKPENIACNHTQYRPERHGRYCPCGTAMWDAGD